MPQLSKHFSHKIHAMILFFNCDFLKNSPVYYALKKRSEVANIWSMQYDNIRE